MSRPLRAPRAAGRFNEAGLSMVAIFTGFGAGLERGSAALLGSSGLLGSSSSGRSGESAFFNAATGNFVLTRQDEFLVGRGPDLAVARTYNSQGALDDNGDQWRQSTDRRIIGIGAFNTANHAVVRVSADGSEITYTYNNWGDGSYYRATEGSGAHDRLVYNSGDWIWTDGSSRISELYKASDAGFISEQRDLDGNVVTFTYAGGKLTRVATANDIAGQQSAIEFGWTVNNLTSVVTKYTDLVTAIEKTFTRTTYGYDGLNRLTTVTVDETPENTSDNASAPETLYTTSYTYDGSSKRVASISQTDGSSLAISYVYDAATASYRVSQFVQTVATGDSRTTTITYTDEGNGFLRTELTDPRGEVTKIWSKTLDDSGTPLTDERGQLVRVTAPPATNGATAQTVEFAYDNAGNLSGITDAAGGVTSYLYDQNGNAIRITDPNGNRTYRAYNIGADYEAYVNANADLIAIYNATIAGTGRSKADWGEEHWVMTGSGEGRTLAMSGAAGTNALVREVRLGLVGGVASQHVTRMVYDSENHLRYSISAEGRVTEFQYLSATGLHNRRIEYTQHIYAAGWTVPTYSEMNAWRDGLIDRSTVKIERYFYDERGNVTQTLAYATADVDGVYQSSEGYAQSYFVYDQSGALLQRSTTPEGAETFVYDGLGRRIGFTDLSGATTTIAFQDASTTTTVTTSQGYTLVSTYNKAGELIARSDSGTSDPFTSTGVTSFTYDKNGNLRRMIDATGRKFFYLYDKAGRKVADIGQNGQVVEYKYDANNRLVATVRYLNVLSAAQISALDTAAPTELELGSVGFPRPSADNVLAGGADLWSWNVYDAGGRTIETIAGDGSVVTYAYDQSDRLIATSGYYNKLSEAQISALIAAAPSAVIAPPADAARDRVGRSFYDGDGLLIAVLGPEGALSRIFYDGNRQKVQEIAYANFTSVALRASGTLDQLIASIALDAAKDVSSRYVYDGQGHLRYTIDAIGRVTELVYRETTNSYANGVVRKTIDYAAPIAALGNYGFAAVKAAVATLASPTNDRVSYFIYNTKGQLSYTLDAGGALTGHTYDAEGRVIRSTQYADLVGPATLGSDTAWKTNLDSWVSSHGAGARISRTFYNLRGQARFVTDAEGYVSEFSYDAEGRVVSETRYGDKIVVTDASTIATVNAASKGSAFTTTYTYDALGRVADVYDASGARRHITYLANGVKASETVAYGHATDEAVTYFEYDQAGKLLKQTEGYGQAGAAVTQYAYDGQGNVASITDPRNNVTTFSYDKAGRLKTRVNALSGTTTFEYDALGRAAKTTDAMGASSYGYFDRLGRLTLAIDAAGYAKETTYNAFGEVATLIERAVATSGATVSTPPSITLNAADATTTFAYDKNGRLVGRTDALLGAETYLIDAFGRVVKKTDARNNASYFYYDALGRVTLSIDTEGYATETSYNARSQIASLTRRAVRATGLGSVSVIPTLTPDALDAVTSFSYDNVGRVLTETDALGGVTAHQYDARGNRVRTTNALEGVTERIYDDLNRLTEEIVWYGDFGVAGAAKATTKFSYDTAGNLTQKIEGFGQAEARTTSFAYDALNRLQTITRDAIAATNSATGALVTPIEYFYYDAGDRLIEKRDAMGARTLYWYDALGRVRYELAASETVSGAQKGTLTRNDYDASGNVTERRVFGELVTLPASIGGAVPGEPSIYRRTLYTYDKLDRLLSVSSPSVGRAVYANGALIVDQSATVTTSYEYDAGGNVVRTIDGQGAQTFAYFDALGRKTALVDGEKYRTDFTYDALGNVTAETRYATQLTGAPTISALPNVVIDTINDRTTNFTYDKMGRRLSETRLAVKVHDGTGAHTTTSAQISYTYNALGQVLTKVEASNDKIAYTYDRGGRLTREKRTLNGQSYLYTDAFGVNVAPTVEYAYNALSELSQSKAIGDANALERITQFTYGAGGRLLSKADAEGFSRSYVYDAAERVTREQYSRVTPTSSVDEAMGYDYDLKGRIIAQGVMVKVSGAYTRNVANSLGESIDTAMMRYNAYGELAERGVNGAYVEKFEYDAAGRLSRANIGDGVWKYFMYDGAGNQSLMIQSVGANLNIAATDTLAEVLALWGGGPGAIATTNVSGVVATITRYDGRNQAVEVREPQRQLSAAGALTDLRTMRVYNAFGELAQEANANGFDVNGAIVAAQSIQYAYNTMGRLIQVTSPAVSITSDTGVVTANHRPTEHRYYDASGRLVGQRDANGALTRYTLLAGSGYNGAQALTTELTTIDGQVKTKYDVMGDARRIESPLYNASTAPQYVTLQSFDRMGRLATLTQSNGLLEYYAYDGLGQRIKRWNSLLGAAKAERITYDQQGRMTQLIAMGGDPTPGQDASTGAEVTNFKYGWSASLATTGMGVFGGWAQQTTYANFKTLTEQTDVFGRAIGKTDLGGAATTFTYDLGARLTQRGGGSALNMTYFNTGKLASQSAVISSVTRTSTFGYDKLGSLVSEVYAIGGVNYKNATASFDALGRITTWSEAGSTPMPVASHSFEYDANGNIRRSVGVFRTLNALGVAATTPTTQDYWYRYDAMNRMVTSMGTLSGGAIVRGAKGVDTVYDAAGNRKYTISDATGSLVRDDYSYDADGRIIQVNSGSSASVAGAKRADFTFDLMGRLTLQRDYEANGTTVAYSRAMTYSTAGRLVGELSVTKRSSTLYKADTVYIMGLIGTQAAPGDYALGSPTKVWTYNYESTNGGSTWVTKNTSYTVNTYQWRDGAVAWFVDVRPDIYQASHIISTYNYDVVGGQAQLKSVGISDARSRTVTFTNDLMGQVIKRDEADSLSGGDPHEIWYRFGGREQGYVGNNGSIDTSYPASITNRTTAQGTGAFQNGSSTSVSYADFDLAYDAINSYAQGSRGASYTVEAGDTLSSIAASLFGDASLWYKIAEVNGLTAESELVEGQPLVIPAGVVRNTNNTSTFKPYDPLEVMGNTSPTSPKPPKAKKGGGCGGIGQVLLTIVAVVVVAIVAPYAAGFVSSLQGGASLAVAHAAGMSAASSVLGGAALTTGLVGTANITGAGLIAGGAIAGAAGSIVSQGIGVMTGIQAKFSWNAVALAAISGGVGGATGGVPAGSWQQAATRAMTASVITQGIGVATGLQDEFSWAGVAAAGVGAGLNHKLTPRFGGTASGRALIRGAEAVASAATHSLIEGTDFGDNVLAALPNAIGQTIGSEIVGRIAGNNGGSGESIFDAIGGGLSAVGDFLGFDGDFGYQGPAGRNLSLAGLGNAIGDVFASPPVAAVTSDQVIRGFGANGASLMLIGDEPSANYNAIIGYTSDQAPYAVHAERVLGIPGLAEDVMGAIGEEFRTLHGFRTYRDYLLDRAGVVNLEVTRLSEFYGVFGPAETEHQILDFYYRMDRDEIRSGIPWQGGATDLETARLKLFDPLRVDIGVGNFNLGTAIDQFYSYRETSVGQLIDPFEFSQYDSNLGGLYRDMLNPDRPTLVYMAALKLADVHSFYLDPMGYSERQGWEIPGGQATADALRDRYMNATGTERSQMRDAGYKMSYRTVAEDASRGIFGDTSRSGGFVDYFHDPVSPWREQVRIIEAERRRQAW